MNAAALLAERFTGRSDVYLLEKGKLAEWVYEPITPELFARHVAGELRIGIAPNGATGYGLVDFDGKPDKDGRNGDEAGAWTRAQRLTQVLDADLGLRPLVEVSRSGKGWHVWLLTRPDDAPTVDEMRNLLRAALQAVGLPDDGDEGKGHPGLFPHPPGPRGIGRAPFLPWSGLTAGSRGGLFVDADGVPFDRQETALEEAHLHGRDEILRATAAAREMTTEGVCSESADPQETSKQRPRHDRLRAWATRAAARGLAEDDIRQAAHALGKAWGMDGRRTEIDHLVTYALKRTGHEEATGESPQLDGLVVPLSAVKATFPEYDADSLVRRRGLHLFWAVPGSYKTYIALLIALGMTQLEPGKPLLGVEGFAVRRRWRRVLWLGDEEAAGELRARAEIVIRGHGLRLPEGDELLFADASGGDSMLDLRHVPELVETYHPDAVVVDPLANLVPSTDSQGRPVRVDLDNPHALRTVCRPLRRLCKTRDVAVFLLHHANASGERERGPTAYRGSADVVVKLGSDGSAIMLDNVKNRDARRGTTYLEPIWTGAQNSPDNPYALHLKPTVPTNPDEASLPKNAVKLLAAIRAGAPITTANAFHALPDVDKTTRYRNLHLLEQRNLVCTTRKGLLQAVALPTGNSED